MRKRHATVALAAALVVIAMAASSSAAAVEFGDNCAANRPQTVPVGLFGPSSAANPLPPAAPVAGVLTSWRINVASSGLPTPFPVAVRLLRRDPSTATALIVSQASGSVKAGTSVFPVRIPIQAGDILGLVAASKEGVPVCDDTRVNGLGTFDPAIGVGGSADYSEGGEGEIRIPGFGSIEADADNDGFGDETQDGCPQSAAVQVPCPPVNIDVSTVVKKASVVVFVSVDSQAPVTVTGTARLGKGKQASLSGGTKTLAPKTSTRFTLTFPKKLKAKLAELKPKQRLTLNIAATATNVAGAVSTDKVKAKLKGTG